MRKNKRWYSSGISSVSILLSENMARYAEIHSKGLNKNSTRGGANSKRQESVSSKSDIDSVLQTAASAAAQGFVSTLLSPQG